MARLCAFAGKPEFERSTQAEPNPDDRFGIPFRESRAWKGNLTFDSFAGLGMKGSFARFESVVLIRRTDPATLPQTAMVAGRMGGAGV